MINKCLFPAAGYGTRFLPATKAVPKEMLPILTKPLLQYAVEEVLSSGISNMAIVTGKGKRAIEDHFDNSFELDFQLKGSSKEFNLTEIRKIINESTFTYVRQKEILGLGHAILTGQPLIGNEAFAVVLADDLCDCENDGVISQMLKIYNQYKCSIVAIENIPSYQTSNYGIIDGDLVEGTNNLFSVTNMVEKPDEKDSPSTLGIIGRYILTPDIFEILKTVSPDKSGEIQITDALNVQAKNGKVLAYKFQGNRFDCGSIEGYLKATSHFAEKLDTINRLI
jgi:UTP--glucose-1-phosphate uridylyltransferase